LGCPVYNFPWAPRHGRRWLTCVRLRFRGSGRDGRRAFPQGVGTRKGRTRDDGNPLTDPARSGSGPSKSLRSSRLAGSFTRRTTKFPGVASAGLQGSPGEPDGVPFR
jgi:hypothetical protein